MGLRSSSIFRANDSDSASDAPLQSLVDQSWLDFMLLAPPEKEIKMPCKKELLGQPNVDYGGHQKAINFTMPNDITELQLALSGKIAPVECMSDAIKELPTKVKIGGYTFGLVL